MIVITNENDMTIADGLNTNAGEGKALNALNFYNTPATGMAHRFGASAPQATPGIFATT